MTNVKLSNFLMSFQRKLESRSGFQVKLGMTLVAVLICFLSIPVLATNEATFVPDFQIKIINSKNGDISIIKNGVSEVIGHVVYPSNKLNEKGFTASQWAGISEVAATSVNAIHIKVKADKTIFSILPVEFLKPVSNYNSYFSPDSSIYTSIHAGHGIFGGGCAPYLGNRVKVNGSPAKSELKDGDELVINVDNPIRMPRAIVYENKYGGKISLVSGNNSETIIGQVLRPVVGVGRFEGSRYLSPGRIRANHPGVIDISTSVGGHVGGFQIIPAKHAQSPEMIFARTKTQWMVVSGVSVESNTQEGLPPLFKYFLKPQFDPNDLASSNWTEKLLSRYLVDVKVKGSDSWRPMPIYGQNPEEDLPDEAVTFLKDVEKIRILFPQ